MNLACFILSDKCPHFPLLLSKIAFSKEKIIVENNHFSDEESPLYEVSARDISTKMQFEVILTMEGITPETGNTIQVTIMGHSKQRENSLTEEGKECKYLIAV